MEARKSRTTGPSGLRAALVAGRFATIVEVRPPDGAALEPLVERLSVLSGVVDAIHLTDMPGARPHMGNLAPAAALTRAGFDVVMSRTCRDRNRIAMQGDLLAAAALGVEGVFFVRGDPPARGDHPEAKAVYDLDTQGALQIARGLADGRFASGRAVDPPPDLLRLAAVAPEADPARREVERAADKIEAGADALVGQPVFDVEALAAFDARLRDRLGPRRRAPVIAGVAIPDSAESLDALAQIPEIAVPEALRARFHAAPRWRQPALGVDLAVRTVRAIEARGLAQGVALYPFTDDPGLVARVASSFRRSAQI